MDQPLATLVAGITAAVGSTTVGVWAVRSAGRNTRLTLENQRQLVRDERAADARQAFAEDLATWLAADAEPVKVWLDKPGYRKSTMKRPPDELIGRALIFEPGIAA